MKDPFDLTVAGLSVSMADLRCGMLGPKADPIKISCAWLPICNRPAVSVQTIVRARQLWPNPECAKAPERGSVPTRGSARRGHA